MEPIMQHETPFKLRSSLRDKTRKLLADKLTSNSITVQQISNDTGLPVYWVQAFHRNFSQKADVTQVQTLYEYLTGRQLEV